MKGGTFFSGIDTPEISAPSIDWRWRAEIDKFANAVSEHRRPGIPNLGNMETADFDRAEPVDIVVFGSPCQSFSFAGKRLGMDDPRGNLALVALAAIGRIRPRWFVFENVPGLLSSDEGRDFGTFLGAVEDLGYGWAYRILDAQHFGVPQRRRRIFVVGHIAGWTGPAAVLFERESLSGHPAPRRETREDVAGTLSARTQGGGKPGQGYPSIAIQERAVSENEDAGPDGAGVRCDDTAYTLEARHHQQAVAFNLRGREGGSLPEPDSLANIRASSGGSSRSYLASEMQVRRLTPRECERLQRIPDDYTKIPWRDKPAEDCPDGPRYKAIGNAMAVPVIGWVLGRLQKVDAILQTASGEEAA